MGHLGEGVDLVGDPVEFCLGYLHGAQAQASAQALGMVHGAEARQLSLVQHALQPLDQLVFRNPQAFGGRLVGARTDRGPTLVAVQYRPVGPVEGGVHW